MEQLTIPIDIALFLWSWEILIVCVWIKLVNSFGLVKDRKKKKIKSNIKEKKLWTEAYPFEEGVPIHYDPYL